MTSVGFSRLEMASDAIPWPLWHPGIQLPFWILGHLCACSSAHVLLLALPCLASLNWWNLRDVLSASWWFFWSLPWTKAHPGSLDVPEHWMFPDRHPGVSFIFSMLIRCSCAHTTVSIPQGASLAADSGQVMVLGKVWEAVNPPFHLFFWLV